MSIRHGMAPTSQIRIGVGQAPMDFEFDYLALRPLPSFDDRNHRYRLLCTPIRFRSNLKVWCAPVGIEPTNLSLTKLVIG